MNEIPSMNDSSHFQDTSLKTNKEKAKLIIAAGFGNFLEVFDFTVYSYFAFIIAKVYFPSEDSLASLMSALMVFGAGFLTRPLGSIVLGAYADKYGRKAAMLVTISIMALGSALIGFAPTPEMIGVFAPMLILFGRLLQGFSAGGEIGAATTLLMESASHQKRGFFISWQFVGQSLSLAFGALFAAFLIQFLSEEQLYRWGWRIPFLFALLIVPVGLYIRSHIQETYASERQDIAAKLWTPVKIIFKDHKRQFVVAIMTIIPSTVLGYIMATYMPNYLKEVYGIERLFSLYLSAAMAVIMFIGAFIGGLICDSIKKRKNFAIILLFMTFFSSFFVFYFTHILPVFIVFLSFSLAMVGMMLTVQSSIVLEAFPRNIRATAGSISYSLGVSLFGGTSQMVITKLLEVSDRNPMSPFWYIGPVIIIGMIAYALFQEKRYH